MSANGKWFVAERAYAFSALILTSRNDVRIQQKREIEDGAELLVELMKNGKHAMRMFGIRIKGCISLPEPREADGLFFSKETMTSEDYNLPLCAFLIDVKKNK